MSKTKSKRTLVDAELGIPSDERRRRKQRKKRFEQNAAGCSAKVTRKKNKKPSLSKAAGFVGENMQIEKGYFRLTTHAKKEDVRPLHVLKRAVKHIQRQYVQQDDENYEWCNNQMKSVRQDLTVQNIQNTFTLEVYEMHARMLLEHGDLDEFNQCQTAICSLVESKGIHQTETSSVEFKAYRVLYALVRGSNLELKLLLRTHKMDERDVFGRKSTTCDAVHHAWQVAGIFHGGPLASFWNLYQSSPFMSAYLMDFLVQRVRKETYKQIIASYRPTISIAFLQTILGFDSEKDTKQYLQRRKAVINDGYVECKESYDTNHGSR